MKRWFLVLLVFFYPAIALSGTSQISEEFLVGEWEVVGVKPGGKGDFQAPLQPAKWEFTEEGKFKEILGANGAQIHWNYKVENNEIKTSFGSMAFSWKVLNVEENIMTVKHHLGIFKIKKLSA